MNLLSQRERLEKDINALRTQIEETEQQTEETQAMISVFKNGKLRDGFFCFLSCSSHHPLPPLRFSLLLQTTRRIASRECVAPAMDRPLHQQQELLPVLPSIRTRSAVKPPKPPQAMAMNHPSPTRDEPSRRRPLVVARSSLKAPSPPVESTAVKDLLHHQHPERRKRLPCRFNSIRIEMDASATRNSALRFASLP